MTLGLTPVCGGFHRCFKFLLLFIIYYLPISISLSLLEIRVYFLFVFSFYLILFPGPSSFPLLFRLGLSAFDLGVCHVGVVLRRGVGFGGAGIDDFDIAFPFEDVQF